MGQLSRNENVPVAIQRDALLFEIRAKSELRRSADDEIDLALQIDPYSVSTVKYVVMHLLLDCARQHTSNSEPAIEFDRCSPVTKERILTLLVTKSFLFPEADEWYSQASGLLGRK